MESKMARNFQQAFIFVLTIACLNCQKSNESISKDYPVFVDNTLPFSEAIAAGKYKWVSREIEYLYKNVAKGEKKEKKFVLVKINNLIQLKDIPARLVYLGFEPAKIEDLLAFGAAHPEIQKDMVVISVGSYYVGPVGIHFYPYLNHFVDSRGVDLLMDDTVIHWYGTFRFLAVRKEK